MRFRKERIFHIISLAILITSIIFVVFYFPRVWVRTWQAVKDLGLSVAWLFVGEAITPTVNTLPPNAVGVLPFDFSEFKVKLEAFGRLFIDWGNIKAFFLELGIWILLVVCVVIPLALLFLSMWLDGKAKRRSAEKVIHNFNQETKPLQAFLKFKSVTWDKAKVYVKEYAAFVKQKKYYIVLFSVVWGLGLNFGTIAIETVAYVVFLLRGFDFSKIYLQFAKLAMDLTVAVDFVPHTLWAYMAWKKFDKWRREKGMANLQALYEKNEEFLEKHKGAMFIVGRQRSGKTTMLQAIAQMYNKRFRKIALKSMQKKEKQFPDFPFINVVRTFRNAERKHALPKLESWRALCEELQRDFSRRENLKKLGYDKIQLFMYKEKYGYDFDNFLFGYDYEKYPMKHNNGLVLVDLFEAIADYGQEFKIYSHYTSLIMSNIPIRADLKVEDYGNFPAYDFDSLSRTSEEIEAYSQISHVMVYDATRLSRFVDEKSIYKYGFEYGIEISTEWAKERGNQISNQGLSKADVEANPKNDGYETNKKIMGQMATIGGNDYYFYGSDDQRPDSISAENRDMCIIVTIAEALDKKIMLPFYALEQAIGLICNSFYDKWRLDKNVMRGDKTLRGYLAQKFFVPIFRHCERIENKFGVEGRKLIVKDGPTDRTLSDKQIWWIIYAHDYNEKFSTNALQTFATKKASRSKYGLEDFPVYKSIKMTDYEMNSMGSYFYMFMNSTFKEKKKSGVK